MRAVLQRVKTCSLVTGGKEFSRIGYGLLALVSIEESDKDEDIEWLSAKVAGIRLFDDETGVMNLDVKEIEGDIMVVSQFTLHASTRKGNRPSYIRAARPDQAEPMYNKLISQLEERMEKEVATGVFGAHMEITLLNDGPVTIILDSRNKE
jgi:D-aminoacyl-tRNA deacylase